MKNKFNREDARTSIPQLEKKIAELEKQIEELKKRIEKLEGEE